MTSETKDAPVRAVGMVGTAACHATPNVPVAAPGELIDAVLAQMRGRLVDSAAVVAVCDGDRLVGLATLRRLFAGPTTAIDQVMDSSPPAVVHHTDQEHAAWQAVQQGEPGLAVGGCRDPARGSSRQELFPGRPRPAWRRVHTGPVEDLPHGCWPPPDGPGRPAHPGFAGGPRSGSRRPGAAPTRGPAGRPAAGPAAHTGTSNAGRSTPGAIAAAWPG